MSKPAAKLVTTSSSRLVARSGRQFGARPGAGAERRTIGRKTVAQTARLEAAGPMIVLLLLALAAVGVTLGWLVTT